MTTINSEWDMKNRTTRVQSASRSATGIRLPLMVCALLAEGVCLPAVAGTTEFTGGLLSALAAQSPSLTFDYLLISGPLQLPAASSTTLSVNQLTISPSGSVGYSYTDCQYDPAPSLTVQAAGQVTINGPITLRGRSSTRTTQKGIIIWGPPCLMI